MPIESCLSLPSVLFLNSFQTGQTPLMLAVSRGNAGMVELLLDAGADVNETDNVRLGFVFYY